MEALLKKHLGEATRAARLHKGLTQAAVAKAARLAPAVYARIERAQMLPSVPTLKRLCHVLGVDANTLLGFSSPTPPAWFAAPAAKARPAVERLLRTARRLPKRQFTALKTMARAMSTVDAGSLLDVADLELGQ
jgi:transcriptional regulator with XRE-family HTH domain